MTSTLVGLTDTIRTAIADQITAAGVNCLPYDTWTQSLGTAATLSANVTREVSMYNGHARLRRLRLAVIVYTVVSGDVRLSLQVGERAVEQVIAGVAADTTAGRVVSEIAFEGPTSVDLYRDENGQMVQIHEIPLAISALPMAA